MNEATERYLTNVTEYAKIVNKTELLKDEAGFLQVCKEYNEAYEKFTEKFITLRRDIKDKVIAVMRTNVYFEIHRRTEINKIFAND